MAVHVVQHPVASEALLALRDRETRPSHFRRLAHRLTLIMVADATRDLPTREATVQTPLEEATGAVIDTGVVFVPVLRAGLSMLDAALELLPHARVGHVGLQRDEATAKASTYLTKLPDDIAGGVTIVLDPMLATGGSAIGAVNHIEEAGSHRIRLVCMVATPEGIEAFEAAHPHVDIYTPAIDRALNEKKYIVPGLGDFGDRLYGTT